ncbi:MAG: araA [Sphingomonas bacterium]|uniref:Gfo/Idh/MocA family protein n=1 Tax=Sphingomonas bacterium TaxID=1895847 RepID=UPI0026284D62|nr:Gfo/Idh/MocA family oxidoreductase [Sphingomonas bacterium]MDB5707542.1 araA [Sphingomonas bacterium]
MTTARPIRIGLVGVGKIARDQHVPAIRADERFDLVATASHHGGLEGVPAYRDIADMIGAGHALDAVAICTPPAGRDALAAAAIEAGLHVLIEKPPGATVAEVDDLIALAKAKHVTLFAAWHSREAAGVAPARDWLAGARIHAVRIVWKEDIRRWHPGQEWILEAGGFGVFDPGINALSIVTELLPAPLTIEAARIEIPEGRASPIAATLAMRSGDAPVSADFDFLQTGPQTWDIEVDTDRGTLRLGLGGSVLRIGDGPERREPDREYARLYARFAGLVAGGDSDADAEPLRLVEEALELAERVAVPRFAY